MRQLTVFMALISFIGLAAIACNPSEREATACERDSDCAEREICVGTTCQTVECVRHSDCADTQSCLDNECVTLECQFDNDCEPGERCEQGMCILEVECQTDADCDVWERCEQNTCVLDSECIADADCNPTEHCDNGDCLPGKRCQSDADCQNPTPSCDPQTGICVGCVPQCAGLCCGGDGCGGVCTNRCYLTGQQCDPQTCGCDGTCQPDCEGRECGSDGCDDTCDPGCGANETCGADGQCRCTPQCTGRECGPDGCGGQCGNGCGQGEVCDAGGHCNSCQPECGLQVCGLDPICASSCGECDPGESCSLEGQCGPWCQLGETRCSADGFGYEACGPDPFGTGENTFGPRIPCALGDSCQAGACNRANCLETEVMIVLDRSSSMLAGGTWDWVTAGLLTKLGEREARNYLGYREFPSGGGCSVGSVLTMDKLNVSDILWSMHDPEMDSATPIAAALQGFTQHYGDPNDGQAVILISDGDETCSTQTEALGAAAGLFRSGVPVHVLAVTQTANKAFLDQLADAGGTGTSRLVTSQAQLLTALEQVFQGLEACRCYAGTSCADADVWTCSADELDLTFTETCPLGCNLDGQQCQLCDVNERICVGDQIWRCAANRKDYIFESSCPDYCSQGVCTDLIQFTGVQTDFPEVELAGWELCYSDTYATDGPSLSSILATCYGSKLLLACRPVDSSTLTLAAMGDRADVTYDCGTDSACVHEHNGVGWYYSGEYSWGFAPGGEAVNRSSCDYNDGNQTLPELRMCWHAGDGNIESGYRCGDNDLNSSSSWARLIYHLP